MSTSLDKVAPPASQDTATLAVLDEVFFQLRDQMKPKAWAKARARLEAYASRLETWEGRYFPENVTPLWDRRSARELARDNEAKRQERVQQAAAIRTLIGRAF